MNEVSALDSAGPFNLASSLREQQPQAEITEVFSLSWSSIAGPMLECAIMTMLLYSSGLQSYTAGSRNN